MVGANTSVLMDHGNWAIVKQICGTEIESPSMLKGDHMMGPGAEVFHTARPKMGAMRFLDVAPWWIRPEPNIPAVSYSA